MAGPKEAFCTQRVAEIAREGVRDGFFETDLAGMGSATAVYSTRVSEVPFAEVQAGGVAANGWAAGDVCAAAGKVLVLLAAVLLVCAA